MGHRSTGFGISATEANESKALSTGVKMDKLGKDVIGTSGLAPFFKLANADEVTIDAP